MKLNVCIVTTNPVPIGNAATNRILSWARGLAELGHQVHYLCVKPTESGLKYYNKNVEGDYKGVKYKYTSDTTLKSSIIILNLIYQMIGILKASIFIKNSRLTTHKNIIIFYGLDFLKIFYFFFISKFYHYKYVLESTEYPSHLIYGYKKYIREIGFKLYNFIVYRLFDGMFVITYTLKDYYKSLVRKKIKIEVIPMTVEYDRFDIKVNSNPFPAGFNIVYCGTMQDNKDGIEDLVDAVSSLINQHFEVNLILIGNKSTNVGRNNEYDRVIKKITVENLKKKILMWGEVPSTEMPFLLKCADLLVLMRPDNIQSRGGFPTKLGEYLSTKKPVLLTSVGEIPFYMHDCYNAFLVPPGDKKSFIEKLEYILNNRNLISNIGQNGYSTMLKYFNYSCQAKFLDKYLRSV